MTDPRPDPPPPPRDNAGGVYFDPQEAVREAMGSGPLTGGVIWPPGHSVPAQLEETLGRMVDPIRENALLAAAVLWQSRFAVSSDYIVGDVLETAERFEAWLARPDQAEQVPTDPHPFVDQQFTEVAEVGDGFAIAVYVSRWPVGRRRRDDMPRSPEVCWLDGNTYRYLPPEVARRFAAALVQAADEIEREAP